MRQVHKAGNKCLSTTPATSRPGERVEVELLVSVMGASSYTYVEATATQRSADWIASHVRLIGTDTKEIWRKRVASWRPSDETAGVAGIVPADAKSMFDVLYRPRKERDRVDDDHTGRAACTELGCWSHARF